MKTVENDALDRLLDEQRQIDDLFETYARHKRDPNYRPAEAARLAALIVTLLRVHADLEASLLQPALARAVGSHAALVNATAQRNAVSEAIERVEAMSPRDPEYALEMGALARRARRWFAADESDVFELARQSSLDLVSLDRELAERQEALLTAGRAAAV